MTTSVYFWFCLFCVGWIRAEDFDFSSCDFNSPPPCKEDIFVNECSNQEKLSGFISTPGFPNEVSVDKLRKYQVSITSSCPRSKIRITVTDDTLFLATENNYLAIGDGNVVGLNEIPPRLTGNGGLPELPGGVPSLPYRSSANSLWIEAGLFESPPSFKIRFDIELPNSVIYNYNETSGIMTSPDPYPSEAKEEIHLIDVSAEAGEYMDLLLTVNYVDLKGLNGDYIKIGPGTDPTITKNSAVISWRVNKGVQFLIDGPRAHLVFQTMQPEDDSELPKGFEISYQVIAKNLTTAAPTTSPIPTVPTPLPFDPDILLTDLVYYNYKTENARAELADVLQMYATSSGMLDEGEIIPDLSEDAIDIVQLVNCYHGWNVNSNTCGQVQVIVRAFYNKSGDVTLGYAFPTETVKAAVRKHGYIHDIVVPEDLINLYWISLCVILLIILIIVFGLLFCWKQKLRREVNKRSKYQELRGNKLSSSIGSDITKGVDNPNFVIDGDDVNGRPVMTYDPEKGTFHSRGLERTYSTPPTIPESEPERTAVLNVTPITSNFQWQSNQMKIEGKEMQMSSIMPPLTAAPKRGILKTNSTASPTALEFPSTFPIPIEDLEDVVLYDNNTQERLHQRRYSPSSSDTINSSSQSSRANSISTDQQISSHVLYGITLDSFSDEENETNL